MIGSRPHPGFKCTCIALGVYVGIVSMHTFGSPQLESGIFFLNKYTSVWSKIGEYEKRHIHNAEWSNNCKGRLRGLAVACWTTDHYHPYSNLGVGISEGCFIFDFASLPLEVARPI